MEPLTRTVSTKPNRTHVPKEDEGVLRVSLLGRFEVSVGSRIVGEEGWRLRKAAGLVKLLALASYHRLHREQAMELLWPDLAPRSAANNLHQTLRAPASISPWPVTTQTAAQTPPSALAGR